MGRFEDLIAKAREGDADALEALEKEFSGSNLREQQEAALKSLQDNEPFIRAGKFEALKQEAGVNLSLEDVDGVDTQDLTVNVLREKAEAKTAKELEFRTSQAKAAGFDSVEEFDKAMETLKQSQTSKAKGIEALGGATASTSGGITPSEDPKEPWDAALEDYKSAIRTGATQDVAMGEATHTLMAAQNPVEEVA